MKQLVELVAVRTNSLQKTKSTSHSMKNLLYTMTFGMLTIASASAQLTNGNILVERLGDGSTALSSASTVVTILEIEQNGSTSGTYTMPATGSDRLTDSGSATSNGYFNYLNGYAAIPGYDAASGTASVASTNAKTINVLDSSGNISQNIDLPTSGAAGTPFRGNNFRSVITKDGRNFFASGAGSSNSGGIWHYDSQSASPAWFQVSTTSTNTRNVEIYSGSLYYSTGSGSAGIYSLGAIGDLDLSNTSANTGTLLIASTSPYGFYINESLGVAFVADDTAASGGLKRYDFNSINSTWDLTYAYRLDTINLELTSLTSGVSTLRGLSVTYDANLELFSIYGTTSETSNNSLIFITDGLTSSLTAGSEYDIIASAGTNYVFRGVDVIPEPNSMALIGLGAMFVLARRKWLRKA